MAYDGIAGNCGTVERVVPGIVGFLPAQACGQHVDAEQSQVRIVGVGQTLQFCAASYVTSLIWPRQ